MGGFPGLGVVVPRDRPGFEGIGFDPAPGDTGGIEALAGDLRRAAKEIDDARKIVVRVSHNGGDWQGEAARTRLATARSNPDLKLAGQWLPDDLVEDATLRFKTASADLQVATGELNRIIARAEALRHQHDQLATEAAVAVKRAGDQAPDGPGWFGHLMDEVQKVVALHIQLAEDAAAWARAHANSIAAVGDLLSNASTLTGLASIALAGAGHRARSGSRPQRGLHGPVRRRTRLSWCRRRSRGGRSAAVLRGGCDGNGPGGRRTRQGRPVRSPAALPHTGRKAARWT